MDLRAASAGAEGIEPSTSRFKDGRSTAELHPNGLQLHERAAGIEPARDRVEACCLSAWLRPQVLRVGLFSPRRLSLGFQHPSPDELENVGESGQRESNSRWWLGKPLPYRLAMPASACTAAGDRTQSDGLKGHCSTLELRRQKMPAHRSYVCSVASPASVCLRVNCLWTGRESNPLTPRARNTTFTPVVEMSGVEPDLAHRTGPVRFLQWDWGELNPQPRA